MQLLPAKPLKDYIKHYLWVHKPPTVGGELHIFGDGNPGIVFCLDGCLYQDTSLQSPFPAIFAYGQLSTQRAIYAPENVELLIVVLQPFALSAWLRMRAIQLNDLILDGADLFTDADRDQALQLLHYKSVFARIEALDILMTKLFSIKPIASQQIVSATISYIARLEGQVSSPELAKFTGYGERYLEKQFKEHVGMTPIRFARTTRMLHFIKCLQSPGRSQTLTTQAYKSGYFDQAHLNHDFKKLTGMTPSAFASEREPLALNFFNIRKD